MKFSKLCILCMGIVALVSCGSKSDRNDLDSVDVTHFEDEENTGNDMSESDNGNAMSDDTSPSETYTYPSPNVVTPTTVDYQEYAPREEACRACNGTGICGACNGTGQRMSEMSLVTDETVYRNCGVCNGTGICVGCGGDGLITEGVDY